MTDSVILMSPHITMTCRFCTKVGFFSDRTHISAIVEEISSEGVAKDAAFSVIVWKKLHLLLLVLIFAFNLKTQHIYGGL